MKKKLKSNSPSNAAACSPSSDFENGPWSYDLYSDGLEPVALLDNPNHSQGEWVSIEDYRRLERDRDEWQLHALMKMAVKQLACMWCGEIVHAPTGYEPGTPLSEEQRGQAYREHVATCPKHPVAPLREALKFISTDKIANAADMRYRAARALESLPENAEVSRGDGSASLNPNKTSNEH